MSEYTPGPWVVEGPDDEPYGDIRVGRRNRTVCVLWQDDAPVRDYNAAQWANARLIVAAPDLLAACRAANRFLAGMAERGGPKPGLDGINDWSDVQNQVFAAITKAEGSANP